MMLEKSNVTKYTIPGRRPPGQHSLQVKLYLAKFLLMKSVKVNSYGKQCYTKSHRGRHLELLNGKQLKRFGRESYIDHEATKYFNCPSSF